MRTSISVKKVSSSNPLRALREQLGSGGKRLSTYKLAELIGISGATLRSVEAGKNAFTEAIQQRLRWRGLNWDPQTGSWSFTYNQDLPLSVDLFAAFARLGRGSDDFQDLDAEALCIQLVSLLQAVPASAYNACVFRLRDFLEQLRVEYQAEDLKEVFAKNTPRYYFIETRSGAVTLVKEYPGKKQQSHKPLDLSYMRKSKSAIRWDEEKHGEHQVVTQPAA
jgi:hypothetical protein